MLNNIIENCLSDQPKVNTLEYLTVEHEMKQAQEGKFQLFYYLNYYHKWIHLIKTKFLFIPVHCFDKFLSAHVNLAFAKGFNDNVGRHLQPPSFAVSFYWH